MSLKKKSVRVADVSEGSEERLRHFLESVVEQANADHRPDESEDDDDDSGSDAEERDDDDAADEPGPDAEMSERFRSFGS